MNAEVFRMNSEMEREHWWFAARRRILGEIIREVLEPSPQTTIVDVGCGTGGNLGALSEDYRCVGIDPSAEAIRLARACYPRVEFIQGRAPDDLGRVAQQARLILLTDVLEHVPDDHGLLAALLAATNPGTYLLITVPADMSLWSPRDERHGHCRRYDRECFQRLWQHLPATPLLVSHFNARLYFLIKLVRAVNHRRGRTRGQTGTDLKLPPALLNRTLERIFRGEGNVLRGLLHDRRRQGYSFGVSLIALLRREVGAFVPSEVLDVGGSQLPWAADEMRLGEVGRPEPSASW